VDCLTFHICKHHVTISPVFSFILHQRVRPRGLNSSQQAGNSTPDIHKDNAPLGSCEKMKWKVLPYTHKPTIPSVRNIIAYNPMLSLCSGSLTIAFLYLVYIFLITDSWKYSVDLIVKKWHVGIWYKFTETNFISFSILSWYQTHFDSWRVSCQIINFL
jgi:hypothetical protein